MPGFHGVRCRRAAIADGDGVFLSQRPHSASLVLPAEFSNTNHLWLVTQASVVTAPEGPRVVAQKNYWFDSMNEADQAFVGLAADLGHSLQMARHPSDLRVHQTGTPPTGASPPRPVFGSPPSPSPAAPAPAQPAPDVPAADDTPEPPTKKAPTKKKRN
ncbi:MAG: hypothetical protein KGJ23_08355 [Euryarchaeota archaeon]|nr:hypothetical protein [Euryarchaeota archaeon]MDE1836614.1 hypothetical protein [Euryarchaeota archaeon]MDE1879191.1 hypothetical protein [Euryarchaeota archaeon]MDE2044584.1 hypothetical protein [Thermoplasmata archaeon]